MRASKGFARRNKWGLTPFKNNGRPRKVLNWRKPEEVFSELVALAT